MNATEFFESQLITDSNSVIDKMKHKFSKHDLIKFADAYASQQEGQSESKLIEKLEDIHDNQILGNLEKAYNDLSVIIQDLKDLKI